MQQADCAYLNQFIPSGADDDWVLRVGRKANARNPVSVALIGDGVFAISQSVPQLDCSVPRTGDDLAVVCREGNGKDVVGVANKCSSGVAS